MEEDGKTVLVFEYGKTVGEVAVGSLKYKLWPLHGDNGKTFTVGYEVTNAGNNSVKNGDAIRVPVGWKTEAEDSTGRKFRATVTAPTPNGRLDPGKSKPLRIDLTPVPNPKATAITVTLPAPPDSGADVWRVAYPKKTWQPTR